MGILNYALSNLLNGHLCVRYKRTIEMSPRKIEHGGQKSFNGSW